jgi:DNA helicase-2/ATP-dependent DNA helicase PcrA
MSNFNPSKYQQAIFDFIANDNGNAVVSAVAGSGKTTTLVQAMNLIPRDKTVLFMAFNKSIATELQDRVPKQGNITVKTVHGFGCSTVLRNLNSPRIDANKYRVLFRLISSYNIKQIKNLKIYSYENLPGRILQSARLLCWV